MTLFRGGEYESALETGAILITISGDMAPFLSFRRLLAAAAITVAVLARAEASTASFDDTAKVLAGLQPSAGSPLEALTTDPGWKRQAANFAQMWDRFDQRQLARVREWAGRELPGVRGQTSVLYYAFSGPDILYANAFFPGCRTYVLCGLEPVGTVPDLLAIGPDRLGPALGRLYGSLKTVLALSFFKTKDMGSDFRNHDLPGTTPVLKAFLARLGKTVRNVELVGLDRDGNELPRRQDGSAAGAPLAPGVKIAFDSGPGTPEQTLYYFSADISNDGLAKNPAFANFCRKLEPGAGLVKAASYLMHTSPFSSMRDFLMERCKFILQDDTGIPAAVLTESNWQLRPYGRYIRPIEMFRGYYQKELAKIHAAGDGKPLEFGIGYHYRVNECNMLLAAREGGSIPVAQTQTAPAAIPEPETAILASLGMTGAKTQPARPAAKSLAELEDEELRIRADKSLTKAERMRKLREIWQKQLAVMGKKSV